MNNATRIPAPEEYGEHIARLNQESVQTKQQLEWQGKQIEELKTHYQALTLQQTETKTLVMGLHTRMEGLDSRLFGMVTQMTKDNAALLQQITKGQAKELQQGTKERNQQQKAWISFGKYVVALTIGAAIVYWFKNGG
ncbi:hypothetical protein [Paenibacillus sp. BK720]|uniref:hypothetical protein n=1 Tax=Paenibacillus sp. BK720 TaxID=2587092 RepID=UPI0014234532|nr:hypothetical protein [Paenibacillus sp. BK720]NIK67946.1 putative RNase H-like nuclease (RuvC/YqgF family) [Paenibacillus sp. BK720]